MLSLQAAEFVWQTDELSEAHGYILPVLQNWLAKGITDVLDIGCGNGALTKALARPGLCLTGIDQSASGVKLAQAAPGRARFLEHSIENPLPDELRGRFDAVVAVEVIEHLLLPRMLFERAREALRPHGRFIVTTPYHGYCKNVAVALCGGFDVHWHPLRDYGHVKFFSLRSLGALFAEQSFQVTRTRRLGRMPILAKSMIIEGVMNP